MTNVEHIFKTWPLN